MNIFIDHVGDGHKHYRMAITSILHNECLRRRRITNKGNVAQVEFYNIDIRATPVRSTAPENQRNRWFITRGHGAHIPTEWEIITNKKSDTL